MYTILLLGAVVSTSAYWDTLFLKNIYENCTSSQFACANGYCIPKEMRCDTINQCEDGSDEKNCGKNN